MIPATTKATSLLVVLAVAIAARGQNARSVPPVPKVLKFSPNAAGELTATAPFTLRLSGPGFPREQFSVKAGASLLHILCTWESNNSLEVNVTGAAGHGLPGRIALASQIGRSPITIEVQVTPEQVTRGSVEVEVDSLPFKWGGTGVVHGTIVVSMASGGAKQVDDQGRIGSVLEEGKLLSASEVAGMEAKLKSDPHDWSTRLSLLAYYWSSAKLRMSKQEIVAARRRHILWTVENRATATDVFDMPELEMSNKGPLGDPEGAREAEQAWQHAIAGHPQDNQILLNAAWFCAKSDPAFSEKVLQQANSRGGDDLQWNSMLGWLYATVMVSAPDGVFVEHAHSALAHSQNAALVAAAAPVLARPEPQFSTTPQPRVWFARPEYIELAEELAARAVSLEPGNPYWLWPLLQVLGVEVGTAGTPDQKLVAQKKVYGLFQYFNDIAVDPGYRTLLLPVLANLAFDVKDDEAAKTYAMQALDLAPQQGDRTIEGTAVGPQAIHDANDVLGRVALRSGNLPQARDYLLKAGATPAGGTMSIVGPRMQLAQALLDHGERDVVLQYLEKIEASWERGAIQIDHWIAAIRMGKMERLNLVDATPIASPHHPGRP